MKNSQDTSLVSGGPIYDWSWLPRGAANLFSLPALILLSAFVGFGGLAREAGMPLLQVLFMVPTIWALPSHLVLVAGIVSGASLLTITAAVTLVSMRMLPMTMALIPDIRMPRSKKWHLLLVSNMVAITAWVHTLQKAPTIPRAGRLPYFVGFAGTMMITTSIAAGITHTLAATLPAPVMAALYFLTPVYFATSTWNAVRVKWEYLALLLGFSLGPVFYFVMPQINILAAGVVGGSAAFAVHMIVNRRAPKA